MVGSSSGFSSSSTADEVTEGIDASNLTAIVTGASSGVGVETAHVLAKRGAEVVMAVRNVSAGEKVKESILKETSNARVHVLQLDLSSMASVRKFASDFKAMNLPLNILINNAGVMFCPFQLSADGIELQFATNHIGHYLLTKLLLDDMKHTAQASGIEGRIVIVSSESHRTTYTKGIRFDKINEKSGYSSFLAYGQSKLANVLHAQELTKKLQEEGINITVNSLHPGAIRTQLQRHSKLTTLIYHMTSFLWKTIPQRKPWFLGAGLGLSRGVVGGTVHGWLNAGFLGRDVRPLRPAFDASFERSAPSSSVAQLLCAGRGGN